jgi:hypothetical protein
MLENPTLYFKDLFYLTGSHKCALFLGQLLYWNEHKGKLGRIAKTSEQWYEEIQIKRHDVTNCHKVCVKLGFISVNSRKFNNTTMSHYTVHKEVIMSSISKIEQLRISAAEKLSSLEIEQLKNSAATFKEIEHPHSQKVSSLITETITENKTDTTSTEINSVPADLFKSEKLKELAEQAIAKGEAGKPKAKKEKKELSPLDKEIAEKVKSIVDGFTKWHLENKGEPYLSTKLDFINLTKLFKKLNNTAGYTPEQTIEKLRGIFKNYDKLSVFSKNNFTVNYLATKHNILLSEIESYKAPVQKRNFNEPVPFVPAIKEKIDYYNTMPLPVGLSDEVFRELGEAVYREKVMDEEVDPKQISGSQFTEMLYKKIRNLPYQEIQKILENYGIV